MNDGGEDMRIVWIEQAGLQGAAGHGVDFYASDRTTDEDLLAVVRGFVWYRQRPEVVEVFVRPPDDTYSAEFPSGAKQAIEEFLKKRHVGPPGWLTNTLYQYPNC
jgi:hypothetical protein